MSGETDLDKLFETLEVVVDPETCVFCTFAPGEAPDLNARMRFEEAEGTTLILTRAQAKAAGLPYEFPCRMITCNVHSSLEAVGFMARIATALAAEGMGVNPVAGFFHDHLFVPEDRVADAVGVLEGLRTGRS